MCSNNICSQPTPCSRLNTSFPWWYGLFLTYGREKIIRHIYKLCSKVLWLFFLLTALLNMVILELVACGWCWCKLVHPVPMLTLYWSCHSLLLVDCLKTPSLCFPPVLFGLAVLIWVLGLVFLATDVHTYHYRMDNWTVTARWVTHIYIQLIISLILLARFDCQVFLSCTISTLTLSSTAQVIYDLAFWMLPAQKSFKQKDSEKIVFLENCFLYMFC